MGATYSWEQAGDGVGHVAGQVSGHVSPDVHQHPGVGGRDLVDEHRAGVGQDQLGVVSFVLGRILEENVKSCSFHSFIDFHFL